MLGFNHFSSPCWRQGFLKSPFRVYLPTCLAGIDLTISMVLTYYPSQPISIPMITDNVILKKWTVNRGWGRITNRVALWSLAVSNSGHFYKLTGLALQISWWTELVHSTLAKHSSENSQSKESRKPNCSASLLSGILLICKSFPALTWPRSPATMQLLLRENTILIFAYL